MKETLVSRDREACSYRLSFIDKNGSVIIDASDYQAVGSFSDGLAPVQFVNKGWGYIDKNGGVIIRPQFEKALTFSEGLAGVQIGGMWGFIDKNAVVVIEPQYEFVNPFSEGIAVVVRGATKEPSRPTAKGHAPQVESIRHKVEALTCISDEDWKAEDLAQRGSNEVLVIDRTGQTILSQNMNDLQLRSYENARFSEGLIQAYDREKRNLGFIDKTGKFVIEPQYVEAAPFSEGLARVAVIEGGEEKVGFIDHSGKFVIHPRLTLQRLPPSFLTPMPLIAMVRLAACRITPEPFRSEPPPPVLFIK